MKLDFPTRAAGRVRTKRRLDKNGRLASLMVEELEPRQLMTRLVGLDVSSYQGTITWSSVAATKQFAFIRASTGLNTNDSTFTANANGAIASGMYAGFYHYAYYDLSGHTAVAEADHFFNVIKTKLSADGKHLMPVLDIEQGTTVAVGGTLSAWVTAFCNRITSRAASELGLRVVPIVYTGASAAGSYFDATIPQSTPLWVAQWPNTIPNPQTANPSGSGDWQTWQFWQYTSSGHVDGIGGGTSNVDLDVLNGDANTIKDYIISSTSTIPNGRWPVSSKVTPTTTVKAWSTSASNGTYTSVAAGVVGTILQGPAYGNGYQRWQVQFSNGVTGWVAEDLMQTVTPSAPTSPTPASSSSYLASLPANFTWTGTNGTSYDVYVDGAKKATVTTNSWAHTALADGTHTWYVVSHNAELTATSATWTFAVDSGAPLATFGGQQPVQNSTSLTFTVTYTDAGSGVLASSLGAGDVLVTGPNGYSQAATLVSVDNTANGTPRTATYSITAPGGTWNNDDNGSYTVSQVASQVRDVSGNYIAAGTIGTFSLALPIASAHVTGPILIIDYADSGTVSVAVSGANLIVSQGSTSYTFAISGIAAIAVNTSSGSNTLAISGSVPPPITFSSSSGSHAVTLAAGATASISSDLPGYHVTIGSGAVLTSSSPFHLASLALAGGSLRMQAGGADPLTVGNLSITSGGQLNLADNVLVWDYTGTSPADALRTFLYNGRNGGSWDGANGIIASSSLGYIEAADLGVSTFGGQSVDTTALLIKPTAAGNANFDGAVNADDYALTDRSFARGSASPHWLDGDFDYSGALDANDYFLIDSSSAAASSPALLAIRLATFGPDYVDALEAPAAVEPASFSSTPISSSQADSQETTLPLQTTAAASSFSFASLENDSILDDLVVK